MFCYLIWLCKVLKLYSITVELLLFTPVYYTVMTHVIWHHKISQWKIQKTYEKHTQWKNNRIMSDKLIRVSFSVCPRCISAPATRLWRTRHAPKVPTEIADLII